MKNGCLQNANYLWIGLKIDKMKSIKTILSAFLFIGIFFFTANAQKSSKTTKIPYQVSIQLNTETPSKTIWKKPGKQVLNIAIDANKGQIVIFEVNIWAKDNALKNVKLISEDLISKGHMGSISGSFLRYSENKEKLLQSEDFTAHPFNINKGEKKTIYTVYDIPKYISMTTFSGNLKIEADLSTTNAALIHLKVAPSWAKN